MTYEQFIASKRTRAADAGLAAGELSGHLFDFQAHVVRWALRKGRAAIFADCGLGKTLMQLEWASRVPGRALIVAPLAVNEQTISEAARFGYDARHYSDVESQIRVVNYDRLHKVNLAEFDGLVLDESSILKSHVGAYSRALIAGAQSIPYRLACTATPAPNDYMELGTHAEFLGAMTRPEMLAMFFVNDGSTTQKWRLKGHARREFWAWVGSWASMFATPDDLGFDGSAYKLPPLSIEVDSVWSGYRADGVLIQQAASLDLNQRRAARRESINDRCSRVAEYVNGSADQWVVWCDLNAESAALAAAIPDAVEVSGSTDREDKSRRMVDFANGRIRVLVTKPKIAGFGMNWQGCANVAFCGLSDSYESFYQAIRRCWRFGQRRPVTVRVVVSDAETAVAQNVFAKKFAHETMAKEMRAA